jgi:hypothetical protein
MPPPPMTRRTLVRSGALAASAATLISAASPSSLAAPDQPGAIFHVFAFQWKPAATDELKNKAAVDIAAFQGQIPGLLEVHVGRNASPRGKGYAFGGIMKFESQDSLDAYVQHPLHQALLVWLLPLVDAIELDVRA